MRKHALIERRCTDTPRDKIHNVARGGCGCSGGGCAHHAAGRRGRESTGCTLSTIQHPLNGELSFCRDSTQR